MNNSCVGPCGSGFCAAQDCQGGIEAGTCCKKPLCGGKCCSANEQCKRGVCAGEDQQPCGPVMCRESTEICVDRELGEWDSKTGWMVLRCVMGVFNRYLHVFLACPPVLAMST